MFKRKKLLKISLKYLEEAILFQYCPTYLPHRYLRVVLWVDSTDTVLQKTKGAPFALEHRLFDL
jgi:hypothetical protein